MRQQLHRGITRWRPGFFARSGGALFVWFAVRAAAQVCVVFGLTRILEPNDYGAFVATIALATLFSPLAGLGIYSVLVREGARTPDSLPSLLGDALDLWWRSTLTASALAVAAAYSFLPTEVGFPLLAFVVTSEIVSSTLVELLARIEQSQSRAQRFGAMNTGLVLTRLLALLACVLLRLTALQQWMLAYSLASVLYTGLLLRWSWRGLAPRFPARRSWQLARSGRPFLVALFSLRLQAEFNKPVLAHELPAFAGNFNIAQRALDLANLPLSALQEALTPRLYATEHPLRTVVIFGVPIVIFALLEGAALWLFAPKVAAIFGEAYEDVAWTITMLALLPAVQAIRNLLGAVLVAVDRAEALTFAYGVGMTSSICLTLWLISCLRIEGAVIAMYSTEIIVAGTLLAHFLKSISTNSRPTHE